MGEASGQPTATTACWPSWPAFSPSPEGGSARGKDDRAAFAETDRHEADGFGAGLQDDLVAILQKTALFAVRKQDGVAAARRHA